jgi:biopolymer transport protein ExbB/TolQ
VVGSRSRAAAGKEMVELQRNCWAGKSLQIQTRLHESRKIVSKVKQTKKKTQKQFNKINTNNHNNRKLN